MLSRTGHADRGNSDAVETLLSQLRDGTDDIGHLLEARLTSSTCAGRVTSKQIYRNLRDSNSSVLCGKVFVDGDIAYNCRTCQADATCVLVCDNKLSMVTTHHVPVSRLHSKLKSRRYAAYRVQRYNFKVLRQVTRFTSTERQLEGVVTAATKRLGTRRASARPMGSALIVIHLPACQVHCWNPLKACSPLWSA